jgi:hypothetical protein
MLFGGLKNKLKKLDLYVSIIYKGEWKCYLMVDM